MFDNEFQNEYNIINRDPEFPEHQGKTKAQVDFSVTMVVVIIISFITLFVLAILFFMISYVSVHFFGFDISKHLN
jgi:hypothetical protein